MKKYWLTFSAFCEAESEEEAKLKAKKFLQESKTALILQLTKVEEDVVEIK